MFWATRGRWQLFGAGQLKLMFSHTVLLAKPACLIALVAISVMCSSGQGEAEEKVLIGVGSASCGKWTEAHCPSENGLPNALLSTELSGLARSSRNSRH